ncbi:hypothetical protein ACWDOR_24190 [Streptosporangium canum]|uniref:hypothetical protein n=1 Tax=Streptosporangium canum TaxID=324952 RepID=UPI0036AC0F49
MRCLSTSVLVVDNAVLTVAIPPLTEDLGATLSPGDGSAMVTTALVLFGAERPGRGGRRERAAGPEPLT